MTTTLLILTSILLALSGLAIMHLAKRLAAAEQTTVEDQHMIKTMQLHIQDLLEVSAVNEQLTAHNRELNAKFAELKSIYWNRCRELAAENDEIRAQAYNRQQELLSALSDAEMAADDNEWLYQDSEKCFAEAVAALEKLQEEHKAYVEGTSEFTANQAAEITSLNEIIEGYQTEIHHKVNRIADLKQTLKKAIDNWNKAANLNQAARNEIASLKDERTELNQTIHSLMADRIEAIANMTDKNERIKAIAHMKGLNEQIARLELDAYYKAEAELTEAIEAAEEASTEPEESPIHIDEKKAWICIGEWARLIVYKHNIYQPYVQHGLGAKIERTKRSDLTAKAQERYNALKAALKSL